MTFQAPKNGFRTFVILWASQSFSVFGSALTFFSITIYLTQVLFSTPEQKSELAFALSAVGLALALPNVFFAPLAGAFVDRYDRKRTLMTCDFLSGVLSIAWVWLILHNLLSLPVLLSLVVMGSILGAFHYAAFDTSYVMVVPEEQLPRANGMMQTIYSLSGILSPGIAASLISLPVLAQQGYIPGAIGEWLAGISTGVALTLAVDGFTFFAAALVPLFLFIPSPRRQDADAVTGKVKKSLWADIKIGGQYIWFRRPLLWLLLTFAFVNFTSSVFVLQPLVVKYNLAADWTARGFTFETATALLGTIASIGGVTGGVLISSLGGLKRRRIYGVLVPITVVGGLTVLYGSSPWLFLTAATLFVFDGLIPVMNAHSQAIWQTQTPREMQGRVFSVRRLIAQFTWPLGAALMGWLGGLTNPATIFIFLGALLTIISLVQLFNPVMLKVEDKTYLDQMAEAAQYKQPVQEPGD
jgi:MFS family permease